MKKCLVLGANGFIGKSLCKKLAQEYLVVAYDLMISDELRDVENIISKEGNFLTDNNLSNLLEDVDVVYHLVSTTLPQKGTQHIINELEQNLIPTIRLLEAIKNNTKKAKIIFASSGGTVYGDTKGEKVKTTNSLCPQCSYGMQKQVIEEYIGFYGRYAGVDYVIARLSNPYGIGQDKKRVQGIVPIFIRSLLEDNPITLFGNSTRDLIYLDDLTDALVLLAEYKGDKKIFNIGSGHGYTTETVVRLIETIANKKFKEIVKEEIREFDVEHIVLDIEETKSELEWCPKISLEKGIELLVNTMMVTN